MNKHLNNFLDHLDGLPENTSNKNIKREPVRQGYTSKKYIDDKTKKQFIGWSKNKNNQSTNL